MSPGRHTLGLCGPDCRYRKLYEGAQASLADMATQQAAALTRVTRLRQGLVDALKQTFPVEFSDAEAQLGRRMSQLDDEVLLAYLSGFLAMPKAQTATRASLTAPDGSAQLRAELAAAGVRLPATDDPAAWASAVADWAAKMAPPQVSAVGGLPGHAPVVTVSDARLAPEPLDAPATGQQAHAWNALFTPPPPEDDYAGYAPPAEEDLYVSGGEIPPPPEELPGDGFETDELSGLFDDGYVPPADDLGSAVETDGFAGDDLAGLFDDEPTPADPPLPSPESAAPVSVAPESPSPVPPAVDPVAALRAERTQPAGVSVREAGVVKPEAVSPPTRHRAAKKAPPKTTRKTARVSAQGPGAAAGDPAADLAAAATDGLTDGLREKMLAVVTMPRPVFVADLANMVGDADLVASWENECRSLGTAGPLRFISAKQRHRHRGALVIPFDEGLRSAANGLAKSWWGECIEAPTLRGAKLYEVAVLLHRVIDKVVTFDIGTNIVTMRVNQPRGLVGIVLVLDAEVSPGSEARAELGAKLEELSTGRLSLMAVCTYAGGNRAVPDLAQAAREELDARGLSVGFPVIAQSSWEFASDGGTSAVSVL